MSDRPTPRLPHPVAKRPSVLAAAVLLLVSAPPLQAQERRAITVDWIFSDDGEKATSLPRFEWTSAGDALLFDTSRPKAERTLERLSTSGARTPAVDAKAALAGLKALLADTAPEALSWPESIDRAGRRAAYVFGGDLFLLELPASRFERLTRTPDPESVPRLSPDGRRLAFVRGNDLFVVDLSTRAETRLTNDGSESVLNGALSWVYWEEVFDHEDAGYWWSEDGGAIAFLRSDEASVRRTSFPDFRPVLARSIEQRYPQSGGVNPTVRLGIAEIGSGRTVWMDADAAPYEYVVGVQWSPDHQRVAVQVENRQQTRLDLYLVERATGKPARVLTETDGAWVNTQDLAFLDGGKSLLWTSDRDGHTHLYLYASDGRLQSALTKGDWSVRGAGGAFTTAPKGAIAAVDEARGLVYFTALEKSPLERHLYRVRLDGTGMKRLSREDGVHDVSFSRDRRFYLDAHSSHALLPSLTLRDTDGAVKATPAPSRADLLAALDVERPELLTVPAADGKPLHTRVYRPRGFDPTRRYPVILDVYGGPGAPKVLDGWDANAWFDQLLLREGYVVASIDNRSATAASRADETSVARRLWSDGELGDLLAGVRWLKAQPWVDPERVGIWGWSGGGMFTLVALSRSKEFKAGIAVAPGTDWRYYDTKFTEAYMKPPADNPDGYEHTSLPPRAKDLHGRLLLVFGTYDDNVHPQNSWAFVDRLIEAGTPFDMMAYPMRKHGIEDRPARVHLFGKMLEFWKLRL